MSTLFWIELDAIAPGCVEGDTASLSRLLATTMPEAGDGLVVWGGGQDDIFNAGYVLPSREHPGYFYCLAAQGNSGVFSMRPICGGAVETSRMAFRASIRFGSGSTDTFLLVAVSGELKRCRSAYRRVGSVRSDLEEALAEAKAEQRFADAAGIRLLIEQLPADESEAA